MFTGAFNNNNKKCVTTFIAKENWDLRPTLILFLSIVLIKQMGLLCVLWTYTEGYTSIFPMKATTVLCTPQHTRDSLALYYHLASAISACWQLGSNPYCQYLWSESASSLCSVDQIRLDQPGYSFATERVDSPNLNMLFTLR